jgi:hypothetical protein
MFISSIQEANSTGLAKAVDGVNRAEAFGVNSSMSYFLQM